MGTSSKWHSIVGGRLFSDSLGLPGSRLQGRDLFLFATRLIKLRYHFISAVPLLERFR